MVFFFPWLNFFFPDFGQDFLKFPDFHKFQAEWQPVFTRWKRITQRKGILSRFKGKLIKTIKDVDGRFDDYSILSKIEVPHASRLWIS